MNAEIITLGTELFLGQIVDTNFAYIAEKLAGAIINRWIKRADGTIRI
jgi:nicotinamide-nucleotide amidase